MNVLSLFSGVGGFDLGLERAGMKTVFQCEWDKHATAVLNRHWPEVPKWGDVSTLTGAHVLQHAPVVDVVAWGSPCQDLSLAGKRAGLSGERSGLFHEGIRIIKEIRELTNGRYPTFSIWENVAGAMSSNGGHDFGRVIDEMAEVGAVVIEWALLDAQYFGVPQRRRRVFVVAVFDPSIAERCPDPLLPVAKGLPRHLATRGQEGQGTSVATPPSSKDSRAIIGSDIVGPLAASDWKFPQQQQVHENKCVVEEPFLVDGRRNNDVRVYQSPVQTLQERMGTGGNNVPVIGFSHTQGLSAQPSETAFPTLRTEGAGMAVAYDEYNDSLGGEVHHALRAGTKQSTGVLTEPMKVRRLTPVECERLMGWPDDWTAGQSDSHRYRQCGNGVASPVAEWIGKLLVSAVNEGKLD